MPKTVNFYTFREQAGKCPNYPINNITELKSPLESHEWVPAGRGYIPLRDIRGPNFECLQFSIFRV